MIEDGLHPLSEDSNPLPTNDDLLVVGTVKSILFEASNSDYKVISINLNDDSLDGIDKLVITGNFKDITVGQEYKFYGNLIVHNKYGEQLRLNKYIKINPNTKEGTINYLSSGHFKGIGLKTAQKIVKVLGSNAIDNIINNEKILTKANLTNNQRNTIVQVLRKNISFERTMLELNQYGFNNNISTKIYNFYREKTLDIIKNNPYTLLNDIEGINFEQLDNIAFKLEFPINFDGRIDAGVLLCIKTMCFQSGNTYVNLKELILKTSELLKSVDNIHKDHIYDRIVKLNYQGDLVVKEDELVYLSYYYESEGFIGNKIRELLNNNLKQTSNNKINKLLSEVESELEINYDDSQKKAIHKVLNNTMTIINGGPGTGKTTIIKGLIKIYEKLHDLPEDKYNIIKLAAPTGRAAKRLRELTQFSSQTIHRLLGIKEDQDEVIKLKAKLLVIDEMSMVDTNLFRKVMESLPRDIQIVFVGDQDQLPSVSPGQVFRDMIDSNVIQTVKLKNIHRQNSESTIIDMAQLINSGVISEDLFKNKPDRSFIELGISNIQNVIKKIVDKAIHKGFSNRDIQVLSPIYRGSAGIDQLNILLQDIINPFSELSSQIKVNNQFFRIKDKVLQLVNNPEKNVFNGDIGEIVLLNEKEIVVNFDGNEVVYANNEWRQLTLGYCISIHKAQGSEFKLVIMPVVSQFNRMLQRNILYTGITRASKSLVLIGEKSAFELAVKRNLIIRETSLKLCIQNKTSQINNSMIKENNKEKTSDNLDYGDGEILTNDKIENGILDPLIGLGNLTPYDFMN